MPTTRRDFLQSSAVAAGLTGRVAANDKIRFATIGTGEMGQADARYSLMVPGVEYAAACDLYDGRLVRAKELFGNDLFTTRDYREILVRRDIDAVIVATPDHWHSRITIDALNSGKDVFCQKPMVRLVEEGAPVIEAQKRTRRILQIGSQYATNMLFHKVRDLIREGAIGQPTLVEAWLDRNTAIGAWQYTIPPDASPATVDWDRFLGSAPKRPFDATRFFRWRNYHEYGTGLGGDLFVHLLSGVHVALGSAGPTRVFATGGLRYWKDGRDIPDVLLAFMDYPAGPTHPAFNLALRSNLKSGLTRQSFVFRFSGSEGQAIITDASRLMLSKPPRETEPGYFIGSFSKAVQEAFLADYRKKYARSPDAKPEQGKEEQHGLPPGYDAQAEHHKIFFTAMRSREPVLQDGAFGFRAAAPSLLANMSCADGRIYHWDPRAMQVRGSG